MSYRDTREEPSSLALSPTPSGGKWLVHSLAFIGLAGPYRYIGDINRRPVPPALLLSAGNDRLVGELEASAFAARLRELGGVVEMRTYPRASHATLIGAVSPALRGVGSVLSDVDVFLFEIVGTTIA